MTTTSPRHKNDADPLYGWVIVGAAAVLLGAAVGFSTNTISVFIKPLAAEFGWQRGSLSLIYSAGVIGLALGGIVTGWAADRSTARRIVLLGVVVLGGCLVLVARANALWQFYTVFFVAGFLGGGAIMVPLLANVGNWFRVNVGLALGCATAGQALGQGAVPYGAALLICATSWRDALTIMGVLAWAVLIPLALLIRQPPVAAASAMPSNQPAEEDAQAIPLPPTLVTAWLSSAVIFCCVCMSVPLMHLVPLAQDRGIALDDAASVLFVVLFAAVFGRICFGKLADLIGPLRAYWLASCWQTVLVFFFVQLDSLTVLYAFAFVYGFGYAGVMTGIIVCVRVMTPLAQRATALGVVTLFAWVGHGIGGYQGGIFFDLTGNYTVSYANAALAGVINLIIVAALYVTITRRRAASVVVG